MDYTCDEKKIGDIEFRCYFQLAQRITGGKWKPKVLFHLSRFEAVRFGALRRAMVDVSEKMLIQSLKDLERDGLVNRKAYREIPPKVEYSLTAMGKSFVPVLNRMYEWGRSYASFLLDRENGYDMFQPGMVFKDIDSLAKADAGYV